MHISIEKKASTTQMPRPRNAGGFYQLHHADNSPLALKTIDSRDIIGESLGFPFPSDMQSVRRAIIISDAVWLELVVKLYHSDHSPTLGRFI
jgi:hypothetical protein